MLLANAPGIRVKMISLIPLKSLPKMALIILSGKILNTSRMINDINNDSLIKLSVVLAAFVLSVSLDTVLAVINATLLLNNMAASVIETAVLNTPKKASDKK